MRQIIVTELVSMDGVVDSPGIGTHPHAGWTFKDIEFLPEAYEMKGREQEEAGALLLGRVTFQEFASAWPNMPDEFPLYNAMPKHVVSRTLSEEDVAGSGWENSHLLRSLDDVRALKEGEGAPIYVHGSPRLVQSLAAAGLVDRYHFLEFPVLVGQGKRLFPESAAGPEKQMLKLVDSASYCNGIRMSAFDVVKG